ncbi:MAG: polysaccharide deacetylase family protein [Hyphomicrobiaceae bacterium]|nr:polysaccharide deacetylase family protein [Hyphomicrobiaceae bacterium]
MTGTFPVVIGICLDAEAIWLGRDGAAANRPVLLSHGAFAIREGLAPLLALLERHGARATVFVPGITAERYPDAVRRVAEAGHEIGSHGHGHKPVIGVPRDEERRELLGGIDAIEAVLGRRVTAWRSPSWEWSANTLDLLLEAGVTVSTSFHDRLRPYRHEKNGLPVAVVELPVQWHLADAPYFMYGGQIGRVIRPAADAQAVWEEEFSGLYAVPGAFYHLTLHVQLIGHPGRLAMLDRHLAFIRGHERARFLTSSELAATVA